MRDIIVLVAFGIFIGGSIVMANYWHPKKDDNGEEKKPSFLKWVGMYVGITFIMCFLLTLSHNI